MIHRRQLAVQRARNVEHMTDVVVYQDVTISTDSYGGVSRSYSTTATYACGLAFSPFKFRAREIDTEVAEGVSEVLVRARFPQAALGVIQSEGRCILVKKWGETLTTPVTFEVQGFEEMILDGIIINLKRLEL